MRDITGKAASIIRILCVLLACPAWADAPADHVVLVSVDGFRPDFYLDAGWPAPTIQKMAREGAHAERVRVVFPSVTYPAHTTMVTGVMPGRHGVVYNNPFELGGQTGRWYWDYSAIRVPTLWDIVREAGGTTATVSWPVTVGAPIDRMIPEVWSLDPEGDRLAPMREGTRPPGLWQEIEREATGKLSMKTYSANYISRDDKTGAAAAYLLETYAPSLLAFHITSPDHFQHEVGREGDIVRQSVSAADNAIRAVVEAAQRAGILERTAFVITGDHGFVDIHTQLAPNVWLTEAGLMEDAPDRGDWRATFHTAGGAALLQLREGQGESTVEEVRRVLEQAPVGLKRLFRIVEREELDAIGADPAVPLALAAKRGITFSARSSGEPTRPASGGTHGYFPSDFPEIYTGFVGWGAGFKSGITVHEMGLEDIAPLISRLLGLPFSNGDGALPLGVLATQPND